MNNQMDEEAFKRALQAVAMAKEGRLKMERQEEDKLWAGIAAPLRLSDALAGLTKGEMTLIRTNLGITNTSTLNKQALSAVLQKRIPETIHQVLPTLDHHRLRIVDKIVNRGGQIAAPKLETKQLDYFRRRGLVFTGTVHGTRMLVMPQEIVDKLKSIDGSAYAAIARRNTEWIKLTHGLLYYYGTLTLNQLEKMLTQYTGEKVNEIDYLNVLVDSLSYYGEVKSDTVGFSNYRVWDSKRVRQEHESRPGVEYYPFSKEQLLKAGEPGFIDRNPSYIGFANYLYDNYEVSRGRADTIAEECVYAVRIGESLSHILEFLQNQFEIDTLESMRALADKLVFLMNNTKQWFLKGHAPLELSVVEKKHLLPLPTGRADVIHIGTRQKIGRNDPCPCGSGKKFKKCCGAEA